MCLEWLSEYLWCGLRSFQRMPRSGIAKLYSGFIFRFWGFYTLISRGSCTNDISNCIPSTYPPTHREVELTPLIGKPVLQQIETITERHNWPKCREQLTIRCPVSIDVTRTQSLHLKFKGRHSRGKSEDWKDQRLSYIGDREAVPIKSPMWLPKQDLNHDSISPHAKTEGRLPQGPLLYQELQTIND